jgi:hypothetical protein
MIINYPTGLYTSILPKNPEDSGNITFTISNTTPPRTNLIFPKIPIGLVLKRREIEPISITDRRQSVGELIYSISSAKRDALGNNARQYELGQVLSFDDQQGDDVDPMFVNPVTEIRHDMNILDNKTMGLSDEDVATIALVSTKAQDALVDELNIKKKQRVNAELIITTQQKIINETGKTLAALLVVQEQSPSTDVGALIDKLQGRQNDAIVIRETAITAANDLAAEADKILADLRTVAVVVK